MQRCSTFEEFWPYYVRAHSKKLTRQVHVAATTLALACAAGGLLTRQRWLLFLAPAVAYGPSFLSHFLVEKNLPLTFGHPLWSAKADLLMWAKTLDGTMDAEVERILKQPAPEEASSNIPTNMATDGTLH